MPRLYDGGEGLLDRLVADFPRFRDVSAFIDPQIDARLWTHFHTTTWPHHLIRTTMY